MWNLLGTIRVRKSLQQAARERAAKRGGGRVGGEGELVGRDGRPLALDQLAQQLPAADFDLCGEELLETLDPAMRAIAVFRLFGYSNAEIAAEQQCSERKIERKLHVIRRRWERFAASDGEEK